MTKDYHDPPLSLVGLMNSVRVGINKHGSVTVKNSEVYQIERKIVDEKVQMHTSKTSFFKHLHARKIIILELELGIEKRKAESRKDNLMLCVKHKQEHEISHYDEINCDYCKLLKQRDEANKNTARVQHELNDSVPISLAAANPGILKKAVGWSMRTEGEKMEYGWYVTKRNFTSVPVIQEIELGKLHFVNFDYYIKLPKLGENGERIDAQTKT